MKKEQALPPLHQEKFGATEVLSPFHSRDQSSQTSNCNMYRCGYHTENGDMDVKNAHESSPQLASMRRGGMTPTIFLAGRGCFFSHLHFFSGFEWFIVLFLRGKDE
jgi:hypothetical protein